MFVESTCCRSVCCTAFWFWTDVHIEEYFDLYHWSVENIAAFWAEVWDFCGIVSAEKAWRVVDEKAPVDSVPEWFVGARLNFAENLLRFADDPRAAIIYESASTIWHSPFRRGGGRSEARYLPGALQRDSPSCRSPKVPKRPNGRCSCNVRRKCARSGLFHAGVGINRRHFDHNFA